LGERRGLLGIRCQTRASDHLNSVYYRRFAMVPFLMAMGFIWGCFWAAFLQFTTVGRFLAARRTWITVVIGIGGDVVLLSLYISVELLAVVVGVIAMSAVGIVVRSIYNEWRDERAVMEMVDDGGY
jgi:hypothetical protein